MIFRSICFFFWLGWWFRCQLGTFGSITGRFVNLNSFCVIFLHYLHLCLGFIGLSVLLRLFLREIVIFLYTCSISNFLINRFLLFLLYFNFFLDGFRSLIFRLFFIIHSFIKHVLIVKNWWLVIGFWSSLFICLIFIFLNIFLQISLICRFAAIRGLIRRRIDGLVFLTLFLNLGLAYRCISRLAFI